MGVHLLLYLFWSGCNIRLALYRRIFTNTRQLRSSRWEGDTHRTGTVEQGQGAVWAVELNSEWWIYLYHHWHLFVCMLGWAMIMHITCIMRLNIYIHHTRVEFVFEYISHLLFTQTSNINMMVIYIYIIMYIRKYVRTYVHTYVRM